MIGPAIGVGNSRRLLARLRDTMAGSGSAQERLDRIVTLIAHEMGADVCSAYIMRAGEVLELFATVGLNPSAVHRTRLRVGEGLVGLVAAQARPLALADAPSHPSFAYRPETGEDPYQSLMGVPVLRGGRVRGVLVIQHREARDYWDEEIETLETIAMVVAELIVAGELVNPQELRPVSDLGLLTTRLEGVGFHAGVGIGQAVLHRPLLTIRQIVAENPEAEQARLRDAVASMHSSLDAMLETARADGGGEHHDILETYRMFAEDRGWLGRIREAIRSGLTADAAVQRVQNDTRARMEHVTDPYLRDRLQDLEDLNNRLLMHLAGHTGPDVVALPDDIVLVARDMGPADLLDYQTKARAGGKRVRAVVLEDGAATSHVCIVARSLDIPVVGRCASALARIEAADPLIVDGEHGQVFVRPAEDIQDTYARALALRVSQRRRYAEMRDVPAVSRDGKRVEVHLNAGMLIDLPHLVDTGADGIGLYRTEIPFMVRAEFPDVGAQTELYERVLEQAGDRPVVFRTLDVGGDKVLPYLRHEDEENPALGWRAIRIALDRPALLRRQLRALLRAARGRELRVMFPMVAEVAELDACRQVLELEVERKRSLGLPMPTSIKVGAMVEVPALLWQIPALLRRVDFLSVGSNDLMQYLYASDRTNPRMSNRYDPLAPGMLAALKHLREQCDAAGVSLSLCGEMAGRPLEAMALLGIGFRCLSVAPPAVGPVKLMTRSLEIAPLARYLEQLLIQSDHSLRTKLKDYARDHGVAI